MSKKDRRSPFAGKVKGNAQKSKSGGVGYIKLPSGISMYSPEPGARAYLDMMPYIVKTDNHPDRDDELEIAMEGDLWWKYPFKTHRNVGASNATVVCPTTINKRCPICEYRAQQIKEGVDKEITDAMKVSHRNLYVVIPKKDKKQKEEPHIWDVSQYLFQNLLTEELEDAEENAELFPDLQVGLTLRVRFDSKSFGGVTFAEASRIDFEKRDEPYSEDILEDVPCLDNLLDIPSPDQLERLFFELGDAEENQKDEPKEERTRTRERKQREPESEPKEKEPESEPEEKEPTGPVCKACGGSGKDSKGRTCRPCRGSGKPRETESEKEDEKCPHGHVFGKDTEEFDECFDCQIWDACMDEKEKG